MNLTAANTQKINADWLLEKAILLDVLRLDKIHPVVSGNKYFKLKYYLEDAAALTKTTIATFGGAWSNHIVAAAFASHEAGFKSIGFIRGEKPTILSATLEAAINYKMDLQFISRQDYRNKADIIAKYSNEDWYWIDQGGYGKTGVKGASEILNLAEPNNYTHIIAAVGTGTMLAGLIKSAKNNQQIIGISSMKGNEALEDEIKTLIGNKKNASNFDLLHNYHFGGFGKHPKQLIDYINAVFQNHRLPLDIVYTGKTFYAIEYLTKTGFFVPGSKLLMIHSGGLQGNNSLPANVLKVV